MEIYYLQKLSILKHLDTTALINIMSEFITNKFSLQLMRIVKRGLPQSRLEKKDDKQFVVVYVFYLCHAIKI